MIKWNKGEDSGGKYIIHMGIKIYYEEIHINVIGHTRITNNAKTLVATLESDHIIVEE